MKKKLMLSSAALLATVGLVACNNKTTTTDKPAETKSGEKKTIKLAALESGYGKEMWPELIKAYEEANPNVKVELQSSKELEDELSPKMKAGDSLAGSLPRGWMKAVCAARVGCADNATPACCGSSRRSGRLCL